MYVEFITTSAAKLPNIPIVDGQIIALEDKSGYYYDMNNTRHNVAAVEVGSNLPKFGQLNTLYVCTDPIGIYLWNGSTYIGINVAPVDGYSYVSKNGEWSRLPYIYECTNTGKDCIDIRNNIDSFNASSDITQSWEFRYSYGNQSSLLMIRVKSGKTLHLDFTNMQITNTPRQFIDITLGKNSAIHIKGLNLQTECSYPIVISGQGTAYITDCKFSLKCEEVIGCNDTVNLNISNCEFDLDNISVGIGLYGNSPIATITQCKFTTELANSNKACYIYTDDASNVQIYGNYLPVGSVASNKSEIDIRFSNSYPPYYEFYRWREMLDVPYHSYLPLIGIWKEIG